MVFKGLINNGSHLINLFQFLFGKVKLINIIKPARMNNNDFEPDVKIEFKNSSIILRCWEKNFSLFCFYIILSLDYFIMTLKFNWGSKISDKNLVVIKLYPKKKLYQIALIFIKKKYMIRFTNLILRKILIFVRVKKLWKLTK